MVISLGNTIFVSDLHPLNALSPILVTWYGIYTLLNFSQPLNALLPIAVIESGKSIEVSDLQPLNTSLPIVVIPILGKTIVLRSEHPLKSITSLNKTP